MDTPDIDTVFDRYEAMQDKHEEILENNIKALESGAAAIVDMDILTVQRDMIYKEVQDYFDDSSRFNDMDSPEGKFFLKRLLEKVKFIAAREDILRGLVKRNSELISSRLAKLRVGKNALGAYGKSSNNQIGGKL